MKISECQFILSSFYISFGLCFSYIVVNLLRLLLIIFRMSSCQIDEKSDMSVGQDKPKGAACDGLKFQSLPTVKIHRVIGDNKCKSLVPFDSKK